MVLKMHIAQILFLNLLLFLSLYIDFVMAKLFINFDDTEIEEYEFPQYKNPILISNINIVKVVVSN